MSHVKLNVFEKVYIFFMAKSDIKDGKFSAISSERETGRTAEKIKAAFPFITIELSHLMARKNQMLAGKRCTYKYKRNIKTVKNKFKKFPDAIAEIDDMVRKRESDICCIDEEYAAFIDELQEKYNSYVARKEYHLAKANVRAAHKRREALRVKKQAVYEELIFLLSEKIRLIDVINSRIDTAKEWRFLRIRYYYGLVCNKVHGLPAFIYLEKDFSELCGESLSDDYTGKLSDTEKKYNDIKNSISYPDDPTIAEVEYPSEDDVNGEEK